jgi:hypothetical protein
VTISNGSNILAADLNVMLDAVLDKVVADHRGLPLGHFWRQTYQNVVASTPATVTTTALIAPFDCFVESVAVCSGDMAGTFTLAIDGNGGVGEFPITVTGTLVSGRTELARKLFDGSLIDGQSDMATVQTAVRVFPKGTTITLAFSTSSTATPSTLEIALVLRGMWGRE